MVPTTVALEAEAAVRPDDHCIHRVQSMVTHAVQAFELEHRNTLLYPEDLVFQISSEEVAVLILLMGKSKLHAAMQVVLDGFDDSFGDLLLEKGPVVRTALEEFSSRLLLAVG